MVTSRVSDEEYNKTVSIKGVNIRDYMRNYKPKLMKSKGLNIAYYQLSGNPYSYNDPEAQAVVNILTSNVHIDPENNRTREDIDNAIGTVLDKILLQDKVKSAKDYYQVNNKRAPTAKRYIIDVPLQKLEDTALDSYIHRATVLQNSNKDDLAKGKMARVWGNPET